VGLIVVYNTYVADLSTLKFVVYIGIYDALGIDLGEQLGDVSYILRCIWEFPFFQFGGVQTLLHDLLFILIEIEVGLEMLKYAVALVLDYSIILVDWEFESGDELAITPRFVYGIFIRRFTHARHEKNYDEGGYRYDSYLQEKSVARIALLLFVGHNRIGG